MGTRFGKFTELVPKGFVEVNGIPMVIQSIETLVSCGMERIIIGTGYHKEFYDELTKEYPQVVCCHNSRFKETNCLYTLWNCREIIGKEDFLLLDSDLVYEPKAITSLLRSPYKSAILATHVRKFQDSYFVEEDKYHRFVKWSKNSDELNACGELIGIHKIENKFFKAVCHEFEHDLEFNKHTSYEPFFEQVSNSICPIYILKVEDLEWYEIDDEADLKCAEQSIRINHKRHTYHCFENNMLKSPLVCYRNERYYQHSSVMNKEDARYLLNTLHSVFRRNGIELMLAFGTLLGAVREQDFIGHDADIDTMIWARDMQRGLDLGQELLKFGITLECYVLPWIYTYRYNDVTCDIDVLWDAPFPISKRYCLIESQFVPKSFFEKTDFIFFQGEQYTIPANYENLLVYHYGKNWRKPDGRHARLESKLFLGRYIAKFVRRSVRYVKLLLQVR